MDHGYAVLIRKLHRPWGHKSEEENKAIAVKGAIWPKLEPDAKDWLVQPCKTEEYHLNIEIVAALFVIMPATNILKIPPTEMATLKNIFNHV